MNLQDKAMLIDLSITQWTVSKTDVRAANDVARLHGNDVDMARVSKQLVSKTSVKDLTRIKGAARTEHYKRTLPWNDSGQRILSSAGYFDYAGAMRAYSAEWDIAVSEFCREYPAYQADAQRRLNGLYRDADYPSVDRIRDKFSFGFNIIPLPAANDFRVDLGNSEVARIRAEIQGNVDSMIEAAMSDVWSRVKDSVTHMVDRLRAFDPAAPVMTDCPICNQTGQLNGVTCYGCSGNGVTHSTKVANPFRDSLVENVRELIALIPTLNITGNCDLSAFAARIEAELLTNTPETLRASEWARETTVTNAEAILRQMSDFI
jgi:hypothetical protein